MLHFAVLVGYSTPALLYFFPPVKGVKCCGLGFGSILKQVLCERDLRFTVGSLSCVSKPGTTLDVKTLLRAQPQQAGTVGELVPLERLQHPPQLALSMECCSSRAQEPVPTHFISRKKACQLKGRQSTGAEGTIAMNACAGHPHRRAEITTTSRVIARAPPQSDQFAPVNCPQSCNKPIRQAGAVIPFTNFSPYCRMCGANKVPRELRLPTPTTRGQALQQAVVDNSACNFPELAGFCNCAGRCNCVPAPGFHDCVGIS